MIDKLIRFVVVLSLSFASHAACAASRILVMGDSLSAAYGIQPEQGWVNLLQQRLQDKGYPYQVINASISGETSAGGLTRLTAELERHHPSIVIVVLGANDGLRGLSLKAMQENLGTMIEQARQYGKVQLVGVRLPPNFGPFVNKRFHRIYETLAEQYELAFTPYLLANIGDNMALFQADGLHPTAEAQQMIVDNIWQQLETLLRKK